MLLGVFARDVETVFEPVPDNEAIKAFVNEIFELREETYGDIAQ